MLHECSAKIPLTYFHISPWNRHIKKLDREKIVYEVPELLKPFFERRIPVQFYLSSCGQTLQKKNCLHSTKWEIHWPFCSMFDNLPISRKYQWTIVWTKMIDLTTVTLNNGTYHKWGMKAKPKSWENFLDDNQMMHLANRTIGAIYSGR